jgi:dienelactone hydrolase
MLRTLKRRWYIVLLLPLLLVVTFITWAVLIPAPMPEALAALQSDQQTLVEDSRWLVFRPQMSIPTTGLILYPGARVSPQSYAPIARSVAAQGFLVVLVPMPLNFAFFAPDRASDVIAAFPLVEHWAVGGHSLGGAMAAQFAHDHPQSVDGLLLWAAYPPSNAPLTSQQLAVTSVFGTRDGLATLEDINASRSLLPESTTWVAINGGNHAQFGWYGEQRGDQPAEISREEQQAQVVDATLSLLEQVAARSALTDSPR